MNLNTSLWYVCSWLEYPRLIGVDRSALIDPYTVLLIVMHALIFGTLGYNWNSFL